jgi:DHA1 family bicyclomycin/chloramphenicol resistance-like MFS transporter
MDIYRRLAHGLPQMDYPQPSTPIPQARLDLPGWLPILLGFLTAVGPVSTDMYLPAFPAIEASLHVPAGSAQITLATWFAGLAIGQVAQGSLSDRFGRRAPLVGGMILYTIASVGCALSTGLWGLSAWRAVAAIGGSAGMVVPRAIVRDLADGHAAVRMMGRLILVMGVAPILAPTLGGLLLGVGDWRMLFWICAAYGATCAVLVLLLVPDTLPVGQRVRLGPAGLLLRYGAIMGERGFFTHALMGGGAMFGMFAYISASSPIYIESFSVTPAQYGMLFGLCAAGYIGAAQVNSRLLGRFGEDRIMQAAVGTYLAATLTLCAVAFGGLHWLPALVVPVLLSTASMGFILPNTTVGALSRHAAHAASASALMGTMQFVLGAISGVLAGWLTDGTARGMGALMLLGAVVALLAGIWRPKGGMARG